MNTFISCDWGTSAFRLRLIHAANREVAGEIKTEQGIAAVFDRWKDEGSKDRISFYQHILAEGVKQLEEVCNCYLANNTIVISGMASSSIGMLELPYKNVPFALDGTDLLQHEIPATTEFPHRLLFVSGARTHNDVMRGEETKLVGCGLATSGEQQLVIMPGTHAKHVIVTNGKVTAFNSFITGELFKLLTHHSVLASSVESNTETDVAHFTKGVTEARDSNLLNSLFHVRTARLFEEHTPGQNYHYLSGLLIGSELKDIATQQYHRITLVASGVFTTLYQQALQELGVASINSLDADEALIAGQCYLFNQLNSA